MADEPKRIIDLTEVSSVAAGDYIAMDSEDGGTKKIPASHFTGGSGQVMWGGIQGDLTQQEDLNGYLDQLPNKADIDGYYEDMSVGSAEQLLSNMFETDNAPYNFRTSGGSLEIGDREYDQITGGTVAWNQLKANNAKSGTITPSGSQKYATIPLFNLTKDHVYIFRLKATYNGTTALSSAYVMMRQGPSEYASIMSPASSATKLNSGETVDLVLIGKPGASWTSAVLGISASSTLATTDTLSYDDLQYFDLTLMLGSTIADYVMSISPKSQAWEYLKSYGFFLKDYYPYNAGQLLSVKTSAHKTVGFNAYDNSTGKAKLLGGKEYQITGAYTALSYSTGETIAPDANGKFTPTADGELTVTGGNGTTTCVHLVWDGEKDGEYEAYEEHTYALDTTKDLQGVFRFNSTTNQIYCKGDTYESSGKFTRNTIIKQIKDIQWTRVQVEGGNYVFRSNGIYNYSTSRLDGICSAYITSPNAVTTMPDKSVVYYSHIWDSNNQIVIRDDTYTSSSAFVSAMGEAYILYFRSPVEAEIEPYQSPQIVDNWGTEEYVDERDVPIPVGHSTKYLPDLKAKIESAPNNPSTDGKYFLQYENGEATYVPVPSEVPEAPSEDGTYVLKATVTSGTATLAWVAES